MMQRGKTFNFDKEEDAPQIVKTEIFESTDKDVDFD